MYGSNKLQPPSGREIMRTIFAWPPHPTILTFYFLARCTLLLNAIIGMGLLFSDEDNDAYIVAGAFHAVSTAILPGLLFWTIKQFRAALHHEYLSKQAGHATNFDNWRQPSLAMLKVSAFLDALGLVVFIIMYPIVIGKSSWGWRNMKEDYGTVTCLIPIAVHFLVLLAESIQIWFAMLRSSSKAVRCPHCSSVVNKQSLETVKDAETGAVYHDIGRVSHELLDEDEVTILNVSQVQETGVCTRTPRISESSQTQVDPNETGESEGDRLISKISTSLRETTTQNWWPSRQ